MEQPNHGSYIERSKEQVPVSYESKTLQALNNLKDEEHYEKVFSPESWVSFEKTIEDLGFVKKDTEQYLSNVAHYHGGEVFVRRASMKRLLSGMENDEALNIQPIDLEPNVTLLGTDVAGIESALSSGFGWVIENKVAGVFGFTNESSHILVEPLESESLSHAKKNGELMRRISGDLKKEDVLFVLFRIHKSVYPETLLKDEDFNDEGNVNSFIIRLYAKNRQTH